MGAPAEKGRVLIVDDDGHLRETLADNLEAVGYETAQAAGAQEAVRRVRESPFDVILMDYHLADGTGIEAIQRIRGLDAESQILMITAHASLDAALKAIQESVDDFLVKPVNPEQLQRAIAKSLEKLRLRRENARLIEDLRKANEELSRLSAMKSKFMSMASHDLSNSLMTLQVSFEMLVQSLGPDEEQSTRLRYIRNGLAQIARLIEDLVDWASIEQGRLRLETSLFDPAALVEETAAGAGERARSRGVALESRPAPGLPRVRADRRRLAQVLGNLVENALRHTPKGGRVALSAERDGACVRFSVRDTGDGIAPAELGRVFESFYQGAGGAGEGRLGLGLSIAREIVHGHGGRIWVESAGPGRGAAFLFTIPVSASTAAS